MTRTIVASILAFGLAAAAPALAESTTQTPAPAQIEKAEKTYRPLVRQSTRERWAGGPRERLSQSDELIRAQALDLALPPANPAFQGGASLGF